MIKSSIWALALGFLLVACQGKPTDSTAAATTTATAPSAPAPAAASFDKPIQPGAWYKGKIGDQAVWMFVKSSKNYFYADYGYDSQGGAAIPLDGKLNGNQLEAVYERFNNKSPHKETFAGTYDPATGEIKGTWTMKEKSLPFSFAPTNKLISNAAEFLDAFPTKSTFEGDYSGVNLIVEREYKLFYQTQGAGRAISNGAQFLTALDPDLTLANRDVRVLSKHALPDGNWLLFCALNLDSAPDALGNQQSTEEFLTAAIFDKQAKCLAVKPLGNDGDDSYFLDFYAGYKGGDQIELIWTSYMRDEARIQEDELPQTVKIKQGKFVE